MPSTNEIRLLNDPPLDGPTNMARDEALMTLVGQGKSPPTLRLYEWSEPTISLGYFQKYAEYESLAPPAGELPVVRRLTGGGAILHDIELTYSLALPANHTLVHKAPNALYELVHQAVIASLKEVGIESKPCGLTDDSSPTRGPFFCFERRHAYDVIAKGAKITGSAQRRTREAVLQHGSLIIEDRFSQQTAKTASIPGSIGETVKKLRNLLVEHTHRLTKIPILTGIWKAAEVEMSNALHSKYAGPEWTKRT